MVYTIFPLKGLQVFLCADTALRSELAGVEIAQAALPLAGADAAADGGCPVGPVVFHRGLLLFAAEQGPHPLVLSGKGWGTSAPAQ